MLDHEVVIIGAGFGGLGAGIVLKLAGIEDFAILERAGDIGGTWRDNTYPDVAVDVPSFSYQFSFEKNAGWSRVFATGDEVKAYIDHCADKYGLRPHIRLDTEVKARAWDEDAHCWRIALGDRTITSRYVISAIGAFVEPKPPDIPGLERFAGKVIRSQRWDHEHDLAGERVAVIGTGSTAVQLIPPIARRAARLYVFQRRPIWVFAKADYRIPPRLQALFRRVPGTLALARLVSSALLEAGIVAVAVYGRRFPLASRLPALACRAYLFTQVRDRELRRKLTPSYGFGCKRPGVSNTYYRTFTRPNTHLVTEAIQEITAAGIRTVGGREIAIDTLVLATGFRLSYDPENYRKLPVRGRDGFDLADFYEREPQQAYEGVSLPQLPNHFMIFGPYSWTGSSWHEMVETQAHHALRVIQEARRRGATMVAVTEEANARFHAFIRRRSRASLLYSPVCAGANTYYLDHHGEFSLLRPTTAMQARRASRTFPLSDYSFSANGAGPPDAVASPRALAQQTT